MADDREVHFQVADRRFWAKDASVLERAEVPERKYPSYVEELKGRTELAERKLKEKLQQLDEANEALRDRLNREMQRRVEREKRQILLDFLEVIDNLERALAAGEDLAGLKEGVRLNVELFLSKLKGAGVELIDPIDQPFDPREAEAVATVPIDGQEQDQCVVEVLQKGYRLGDQLIRPARVRVGVYHPNR